MPRFEGCVEAKEISLCPISRGGGANQHAHALVFKHADPPGGPETKPENKIMPVAMTDAEKAAAAQAEINKAARAVANKIAGMSDVTKAYYLALDDDKQEAFLAKSAEDMAAEAKTAAEEVEKKRLEDEAAKSGITPQVLELQKSNQALTAQVAELQKAQVERDIEKRADAEFAGYPGGSAKVIPLLKAYAKLPEDERLASEAVLKAQAQAAQNSMRLFAGRSELDVSKADGAQQRIDAGVKKYLADHPGVTAAKAFEKVTEMPEFAEDVAIIG